MSTLDDFRHRPRRPSRGCLTAALFAALLAVGLAFAGVLATDGTGPAPAPSSQPGPPIPHDYLRHPHPHGQETQR